MELKLEKLPDHTQCDFGKWIASPEGQALKSLESFPEMFDLHEQVHILAHQIAEHHHRGRQEDAIELMDEFERVRIALFAALDKLYRIA